MKPLTYTSLALGMLGLWHGAAEAGGHLHGHHTTTTTTTTRTSGAPVFLAPAAQPVYFTTGTLAPSNAQPPVQAPAAVPLVYLQAQPVAFAPQPVAQLASPSVGYYYYQAQTAAPVAPAAAVAPSVLAPISTASPLANASGQAAAPFALPLGGNDGQSRTGRIFQKLRDFASGLHIDRDTLTTTLRDVGLGLLRGELAQFGLAGLVPNPSDQNVIADLVNRVVNEKLGGGGGNTGNTGATGNTGSDSPQFIFQGPVTLSFPNVQTVQIQSPAVNTGTTSTATPPATGGTNAAGNPAGDAVAPVAPPANLPGR